MNESNYKATLEFNLDDPEAKKTFNRVMSVHDMYDFICDISNFLGKVDNCGYPAGGSLQDLIDQTADHTDDDGDTEKLGDSIIRAIRKEFFTKREEYGIDTGDYE